MTWQWAPCVRGGSHNLSFPLPFSPLPAPLLCRRCLLSSSTTLLPPLLPMLRPLYPAPCSTLRRRPWWESRLLSRWATRQGEEVLSSTEREVERRNREAASTPSPPSTRPPSSSPCPSHRLRARRRPRPPRRPRSCRCGTSSSTVVPTPTPTTLRP
jgi:hypothetical protein